MVERLIIAGSGGQGVLLIGRILATVAANEVPHVTFFPTYGAEVRGGTSNCQVVLSTDPIPSAVCETFDSLILMSRESVEAYLPKRAKPSLAIINSSLCPPAGEQDIVSVAASEAADRLGDARAANFIMLGAYLARKPVLPASVVEEGARIYLAGKSPAVIELNIEALRAGLLS